jgi:glycosyltransferase involved in cell wall biosynthesis
VAAIPELLEDGVSGALVPPDDPAALAEALARLIRAPGERDRLGAAGQRRVRADFDMNEGIDALAARLEGAGTRQAAE